MWVLLGTSMENVNATYIWEYCAEKTRTKDQEGPMSNLNDIKCNYVIKQL